MRLSTIAILIFCLIKVSAQGKDERINVNFIDASLEEILDTLSSQTGYFFSYNSDLFPKGNRYTISADKLPVDQFLSKLLVGTNLEYSFFKNQIILNYKPPETPVAKRKKLFKVSGFVVDDNGKPLEGVNVFLDGTTLGTATNENGEYLLGGIPPGYYDLVFSYIGFERGVYNLAESNGGARIQSHRMLIKLNELPEVEISSPKVSKSFSQWPRYFAMFKADLLGTSENASSCTITNPEVIDFFYDDKNDRLTASASEPIKIINEAMAYKITYYLETFERSGLNLRYRGRMRFQNHQSKINNRFSKVEVRSERRKSYYGSFVHFRKALLGSRLRKEGFRVFETKSLSGNKVDKLSRRNEADIVAFKGRNWELDFKNYLLVLYVKEKESPNFLTDGRFSSVIYEDYIKGDELFRQPSRQISLIKLLSRPVRLDLNGQVIDKFAITSYGYWSWERLANLVPLNYDPKFDNL